MDPTSFNAMDANVDEHLHVYKYSHMMRHMTYELPETGSGSHWPFPSDKARQGGRSQPEAADRICESSSLLFADK